MPKFLFTVMFLILMPLFAGCNRSSSDDTSTTSQPGTFWQLPDDSEMSVKTEPWPPKAGRIKVLAEVGPGDWSEQPFSGSISFRSNPKSPWVRMRSLGVRDDFARFELELKVKSGSVPMDFKVESSIFDAPVELSGWKVKVR